MRYQVTYPDGHRAVLQSAHPKEFEAALAEEQRRGHVKAYKCADCGMVQGKKLCAACRDFRKAFTPNKYGEYA